MEAFTASSRDNTPTPCVRARRISFSVNSAQIRREFPVAIHQLFRLGQPVGRDIATNAPKRM